jgi:hypothetical protein
MRFISLAHSFNSIMIRPILVNSFCDGLMNFSKVSFIDHLSNLHFISTFNKYISFFFFIIINHHRQQLIIVFNRNIYYLVCLKSIINFDRNGLRSTHKFLYACKLISLFHVSAHVLLHLSLLIYSFIHFRS